MKELLIQIVFSALIILLALVTGYGLWRLIQIPARRRQELALEHVYIDDEGGLGELSAEEEVAAWPLKHSDAPSGTMIDELQRYRLRAAEAARAYQAGKLSWDQFRELFGDSEDVLVGEVVTLIEHEPQRGGLLGVNEENWSQYQSQLASAIAALES